MDFVWKLEVKLHRIELPWQHVSEEEQEVPAEQNLYTQESSPAPQDQEQPEPPQVKEEQEEVWTSLEGLKQDSEAFVLIHTNELPQLEACKQEEEEMEALVEQHLYTQECSSSLDQQQPEHLLVKYADKAVWTCPEELKQEADVFALTPTKGENNQSEAKQESDSTLLSVNIHAAERHDSDTSTADVCGKTLNQETRLKKPKKKSLSSCTHRTPLSESSLLSSQREIQSVENPHQCKVCGKTLRDGKGLKRHTMNCHKLFPCKTRGKEFGSRQNMEIHMRRHAPVDTGERHACKICGKDYTRKFSLNFHVRTKHKDLPQQQACEEEEMEVPAEQHLNTQESSISRDQEQPEPPQVGEVQEEEWTSQEELLTNGENDQSDPELTNLTWLLPYCDNTSESQQQRGDESYSPQDCIATVLNSQTEIHTQERLHPCNTCGERFKDMYSLTEHMLIHNKPFSCEVCGKEFRFDKSLKLHMRGHRGETSTHKEPPQVKEEQEEVWTYLEGLKQEADTFLLTPFNGENGESEPELKSDPGLFLLNFPLVDSQYQEEEFPQQQFFEEEEEEEIEIPVEQLLYTMESSSSQDQEHPEPEVCTNLEGLRQDTDAFLPTPTNGEDDHSEPEQESDSRLLSLISYAAESRECREREQKLSSRNSTSTSATYFSAGFFKCDVCRKGFYSESRLKVHMSIHKDEKPSSSDTSGASSMLNSQTEIPSRQELHQSKTCGLRLSSSSVFKNHLLHHKLHMKPYSCISCGMEFKLKRDLTQHIQVHTVRKPYICTVCQEGFSESSEVKRHLLSHYDERPYICEVCGKDFRKKSAIISHIRRSHNTEQVSLPSSRATSLYEMFKLTYQEAAIDSAKM